MVVLGIPKNVRFCGYVCVIAEKQQLFRDLIFGLVTLAVVVVLTPKCQKNAVLLTAKAGAVYIGFGAG